MAGDPANIRVERSPEKSETITKSGMFFPLRFKLALILIVAAVPCIALTVFSIQVLSNVYAAVFAFLIFVFIAAVLLDYTYVQPAKGLLSWLKLVRANSFKNASVLSVSSRDEYGELAKELSASMSLFWNAEERVQTLIAHKRDTTALIEHQLRSPLTALMWSLKETQIPQEVEAVLVRLESTVRTIVETTQIEEGKFGYVFASVDIAALIETLITRTKPLADSRNVTLTFQHDQSTPHVRADQDRLGVAIVNILLNAIEYTPNGGTVVVVLAVVGKNVGVSIQDSGIGIPREEMPLIFNKLFRGANARKMRVEGSGLGLYVAKNILEAHGAEIAVPSH